MYFRIGWTTAGKDLFVEFDFEIFVTLGLWIVSPLWTRNDWVVAAVKLARFAPAKPRDDIDCVVNLFGFNEFLFCIRILFTHLEPFALPKNSFNSYELILSGNYCEKFTLATWMIRARVIFDIHWKMTQRFRFNLFATVNRIR